jgi:glycerophosphoryl diester phosphodiesterase
METQVLKVLRRNGYALREGETGSCQTLSRESIPCGHVVLQSFDRRSLEYLHTQTDMELMMLVDDDPVLLTRQGLDEVSKFATYYSVWKEFLYTGVEAVLKAKKIDYDTDEITALGGFIPNGTITDEVHGKGMLMGIYTLYDSREPSMMGCSIQCRPENKTFELFHYFGLGVDAMFVENIKEATELRLKYDYLVGESGNSSAVKSLQNFWLIFTSTLVVVFLKLNKY